MNWVELLGYAASLLVAISLTMSSLARLRALNLVGAVLFAGDAISTSAWPAKTCTSEDLRRRKYRNLVKFAPVHRPDRGRREPSSSLFMIGDVIHQRQPFASQHLQIPAYKCPSDRVVSGRAPVRPLITEVDDPHCMADHTYPRSSPTCAGASAPPSRMASPALSRHDPRRSR